MAHVDEVLKKLVGKHINDYILWLFGESVQVVEKLGTELAQGKRADLVYGMTSDDGNEFIFHLEFQQDRSNEPMNLRMVGYDVRLREVYRLPVCGVVIYLKPSADEGSSRR